MQRTYTGHDRLDGHVRSPGGILMHVAAMGHWRMQAFDPMGNLIREDEWDNLVVNEGLDHLLSVALAAGTQITSWYVGLTAGTPTPAAGDTMASHAGWTEQQGYDEVARQTWTPGAVSGQSVDNSSSVAAYTITADATTVGGAFLTSVNTKGGTTGVLYSIGAFSGGDVTLSAGSTLNVSATFTTAAA